MRIAESTNTEFAGRLIARGRPVSFEMNGKRLTGFEGDTVLSALLASGVATAGLHNGSPVGLSERIQPAIYLRGDDSGLALPPSRTPIWEGAAFSTRPQGHHGFAARVSNIFRGQMRSLDCDFSRRPQSLFRPDAQHRARSISADVVVVGGGIAGLTAALHLAERGRSVILIERQMGLGGDAPIFGVADGEPDPHQLTSEAGAKLPAMENVTILIGAEAFDAHKQTIHVHRVDHTEHSAKPEVLECSAPHIVLATGCLDRLPVFSGNKLPGVIGLADAFHLAADFGVWPAPESAISGNVSAIFRLGMLAHDGGIKISKVADHRLEPRSRFLDFAKAYGLPLVYGLSPRTVRRGKSSDQLEISLATAWGEAGGSDNHITAQSFVVTDGWQPRLRLWSALGGHMTWNPATASFGPGDGPEGIQLCGSAAGFVSLSAVVESGRNAARKILKQKLVPAAEKVIDPAFESPDGARSEISPDGESIAYLSGARTLAKLPDKSDQHKPVSNSDVASARLTLEDVATLVHRYNHLEPDAGEIASERILRPRFVTRDHRGAPPISTGFDPRSVDYLDGRVPTPNKDLVIRSEDGRRFEPGALVFPSSDLQSIDDAVGVVLGEYEGQCYARISTRAVKGAALLSVREGNRSHMVHID